MFSPQQNLQNQLILSQIPVNEILEGLRQIVREEIKSEKQAGLQEKLLSPSETCKLFQPNISKVTLANWSEQGLLKKHSLGGRIFYKYSEILESLKTLKKYKKPV